MASDLQALRAYVTAPSSQNQRDSTVRVNVTHSNLKASFMEIILDLHVRDIFGSSLAYPAHSSPS
jgi:hypothetical protein